MQAASDVALDDTDEAGTIGVSYEPTLRIR